ncbi:MAG: RDD family protein [Pseudomonadota bacterium]|nr:RDD family protein [Pseudomonadota bacterium]
MNTPSLLRRLACNLYESLLLIAVLFVAALPFVAITLRLPPGVGLVLRQIYLWVYLFVVAGIYCTLFWRRGQTLAMKTWGIRLVAENGEPPSRAQVWLRYLLACLNLALLGIGWWAALLRDDRQFLQDRFAGTRLLKNSAPFHPPQGDEGSQAENECRDNRRDGSRPIL